MELAQGTPDCLDDASIAAVVEGRAFDGRDKALSHVSECAFCRYRVAAVARVAQDPAIKKEIETLEPERHSVLSPRVGWRFFATAGLAAAAAAAILIEPEGTLRERFAPRGEVHREAAITTTESPRIISPTGRSAARVLQWTSVPEADMYRVRIWNQSGDVIWSSETRDTAIAIPSAVERGVSYLWEVNARTGWDRWTSSEFVEFTIGPS